jgi:hypothetical protein
MAHGAPSSTPARNFLLYLSSRQRRTGARKLGVALRTSSPRALEAAERLVAAAAVNARLARRAVA